MNRNKTPKTRIYLVNGDHVDVRGEFETIQSILDNTSARWAHFDLANDTTLFANNTALFNHANDTPVSLQISWITYISDI